MMTMMMAMSATPSLLTPTPPTLSTMMMTPGQVTHNDDNNSHITHIIVIKTHTTHIFDHNYDTRPHHSCHRCSTSTALSTMHTYVHSLINNAHLCPWPC